MLKRLQQWYYLQSNGWQLLIIFFAYYTCWLAFEFFIWHLLLGEAFTSRTFVRKLPTTILFTSLFHWSRVQQLFRKGH